MREATSFEVGIWKMREAGASYNEIAAKAKCSKGVVSGILYRISHGLLTLPIARPAERAGCRWVNGDPRHGGWTWCGAPAIDGTTWCEAHRARVYLRVRQDGAA